MIDPGNTSVLLEELRVTEEELRAQNEELADAHALVAAERERYRGLFEHAPVPYLVTDAEGTILDANGAAAALLHCRRDRLTHKPLAVFVEPASRTAFREKLRRAARAGEPISLLLRMTPRDSETRVVTATVGPVVDRDGNVLELRWMLAHGLARAITPEGAAAVRAAQVARDEAERSHRAMSDLLGWVSHELRTPIASIGGYTDILALGVRGPMTPDQQAIIVRIQQSQSHLVTLLEDLLTFARADSGHLHLEIGAVLLAPVLERLLTIAEPQAAQRDIRLHVSDARTVVRADAERTLQVLINLVGNSIKFTPLGGRIDVRCEPEGEEVVITVQDTGPGVPVHAREHIFEPYVQLTTPRDVRVAGVGLGLAISRRLARAMGGDLDCCGTPDGGSGSIFRLRLPRSTVLAGTRYRP